MKNPLPYSGRRPSILHCLLLVGLVGSLIVIGPAAAAQTVSGQVVSDADGQPLPGVNALVKSTASGTVADLDGNYRSGLP